MKNLMKGLMVIVTGLAMVSLPAFALSSVTSRLGVINVQEVMKSSPKLAQKIATLRQQFKKSDEQLVALGKQIEADNQKLNREGPTMSDNERKELKRKIRRQSLSLQEKQDEFHEEVAKKEQDEMREVLDQVKKAVDKVAAKNNLDLVLQRSGLPFASKRLDITEQVKQALNS